MRVAVWCQSLAKMPGRSQPSRLELVVEWEDLESTTPLAAAERAWKTTNAHPEFLADWMLEARKKWDSAARGRTLGVGDVVEVEGARLVCTPTGFSPA